MKNHTPNAPFASKVAKDEKGKMTQKDRTAEDCGSNADPASKASTSGRTPE